MFHKEIARYPDFSHAFQPIVDIKKGAIVSYEALLRGINSEPPFFVFDQIENKYINDFDQLNREKAIEKAVQLGLDCCLNLNFSPGAILYKNGKYVEDTVQAAKRNNLDPRKIIIEITESEIVKDISMFSQILNNLRRTGIVIAIDDFGAGYAGLNLLADIQPDLIKIDMHLLREVDKDGPRQAIVRAIYNACYDLGVDVLAEGVESKNELDFLSELGLTLYQGYYFSEPGFETLPGIESIFLPDDYKHLIKPVNTSLQSDRFTH